VKRRNLGFKTAIVPKAIRKGEEYPKGIEIIEVRSLDQALDGALKKEKIKQDSQANLQRLLLKLDEPWNHSMAISGIVNYGADAVEGLVRLLDSEDPDARYGAALALGNIRDQRAIPSLIKSLNDKHPTVRFFAMDALGKLKATEAAPAIGELLDDESPNIRKHANNVLLSFNTAESFQILREKSRPKWWPFEG
jgi:HEAT repeat protein